MTEPREAICVQLLSILGKLKNVATKELIVTTARNLDEMEDLRLPAAVLFDSDELAADNPRALGMAGNVVTMTPEIVLALMEVPETIGTTTNAWRQTAIKAILSDAILAGLCGSAPHTGVRYVGCSSSLHAGRASQVMLTLHFNIAYAFNPSDL